MSDDPNVLDVGGGPGGLRAVFPLLQVGQIERARQIVMDHLAQVPDDPAGHLALSQVLQVGTGTEAALGACEDALARAPDWDDAHAQRSVLLLRLGRFAESEEAVRRAIELAPADATHHAQYASLLSVCDRDREALARCEHALSLDADLPGLHGLRARLLLHVPSQHWTLSEEAARTALRMDPDDGDNHAIYGLVLLRAGRNDQAEEAFRAALRLEPEHPLALRGLSELVMGHSPLYRPMLWFSQRLSRLGTDGQLGVLFGLWALYAGASSLIPAEQVSARDLLTALYFGLCAYTWFAAPLTRALLKRAYPWLT